MGDAVLVAVAEPEDVALYVGVPVSDALAPLDKVAVAVCVLEGDPTSTWYSTLYCPPRHQ